MRECWQCMCICGTKVQPSIKGSRIAVAILFFVWQMMKETMERKNETQAQSWSWRAKMLSFSIPFLFKIQYSNYMFCSVAKQNRKGLGNRGQRRTKPSMLPLYHSVRPKQPFWSERWRTFLFQPKFIVLANYVTIRKIWMFCKKTPRRLALQWGRAGRGVFLQQSKIWKVGCGIFSCGKSCG